MKDKIIEYFVDKGIEITIGKHEDYGIYYDLNTGMKSHAHMVFVGMDDYIKVYMRYGEHDSVDLMNKTLEESIEDLCHIIKGCLHGRDFISSNWADLLVELGLLTKHVETVVTYK